MELRYKTKIDIFQTLLLTIELVAGLVFGCFLIFKSVNKSNNGMLIFGILLIVICSIQILRVVRRFDLYDEVLIVSRPLSMTSKTNTVLKINDIKKITFRNIIGKGGPILIVNSLKLDETYRINFPKNSIDEFETELNKLGIETVRDGI